jgi:tetratricopeptide (TPR) repeat protein
MSLLSGKIKWSFCIVKGERFETRITCCAFDFKKWRVVTLISVMGLSAALFWSRYGYLSLALGVIIHLVYSYGASWIPLRFQRRGIRLVKQGLFEEAIAEYEKSYVFFSNNLWIDRFRHVILLVPTQWAFRELALLNIAYCHGQLGNKIETIAAYERVLQEFPDNYMAQTSLKFITTIEQGE